MRKLISFALFAVMMILLLAAKSADAQVIVKAKVVRAPIGYLKPCPRVRYYGVRMYHPTVIAPVAYIPRKRIVAARIY
ncbi:MAG TPA: hypothetical protein VG737_16230 [Cyclobacteriaceae bacterium]|nr:hypothetical protein [Cyclobacteriaceae bacterium]